MVAASEGNAFVTMLTATKMGARVPTPFATIFRDEAMSEETGRTYDAKREKYIEILKPLFLPEDPVSHDIINYFASLLRVSGWEAGGWDPYAESRATLGDLNSLFEIDLPIDRFPDTNATHWRIGLLFYSHVVEMDAPYEVLTNLLRFRLGRGYSPNPFHEFLTERDKKSFGKRSISTGRKIEIIQEMATEAGLLEIAPIFGDFYNNQLRNAVGHSDYILATADFRSRGSISRKKAFRIPYSQLDGIICAARAFIAAFFQVELLARQVWGQIKHQAVPYDPHYKGLMEVLVDAQDVMCGFRVHWPNGSECTCRRTEDGIEMINCYFDKKDKTIGLFVNQYAQKRSEFSPLVERGTEPVYSKLKGCDVIPTWPTDA